MRSFHIHITGIVQGVGFRPFVYKLAKENKLKGWVNNTTDGVHVHINSDKFIAQKFLDLVLENIPPLAVVTDSSLAEVSYKVFENFEIITSDSDAKPNILLTPDAAICEDCKKELHHVDDRRFQYPFITCTNCGPRYSIINELPYDRPFTTMEPFQMCKVCKTEYDNPLERRHYSQTNSCPDCKIEMQLFENGDLQENFTDLDYIIQKWKEGKIVAIKGIGGYLLTCDATNTDAIKTLRERKKRPTKPFALMYRDCKMIAGDVNLREAEKNELTSRYAPIVLLEIKAKISNQLPLKLINNKLSRIGIMLPYTPLYELLLTKLDKPIIATSANITDSTIIYTDKNAFEELSAIADVILLNNREILLPQDDGVIQFTRKHKQKITLRRSRGKAPTYINPELEVPKKTVFAAGAMLKSVFGLLNMQNIYVSQYMGNTASYDAQLNYEHTFVHFSKIFSTEVDSVVVDKHPDYFATEFGKELSLKNNAKLVELQHHKAHFYSVLGENNLLDSKENILGIIWDGTGLGDDYNIWGGEFFMYANHKVERVSHIDEFDFILGDKMPKEPKISALAIAYKVNGAEKYLKEKFNKVEWAIYQKLLSKKDNLKSTSMGRLFDAVSSILLGFDVHSFEAEASMQLENVAAQYYYSNSMSLADSYLKMDRLPANFVESLLKNIFDDLDKGIDGQCIAAKFHITLVDYIIRLAEKFKVSKIAFSGGVFQNALLVDLVIEFMDEKNYLYFQDEFSPNDEGIPFGQLMYFSYRKETDTQRKNE